MDQVLDWLLSNGLIIAAFVASAAASTSFVITAKWRRKLSDVLRGGESHRPLKLFDLSVGSASNLLASRTLVEPERLWTYDDHYVAEFIRTYARNEDRSFRSQRLSLDKIYRQKVLSQWDPIFAGSLALFATCADIALANAFENIPIVWHLLVIAAGMALVYGGADIAEDAKLASILKHPGEIDAGQTAAANALTRIKIVTITLSLTGILLFGALSAVMKVIDKDSDTTPTSNPSPELAI